MPIAPELDGSPWPENPWNVAHNHANNSPMDRSNFAALAVFAEVAATRSFRAAARSLGLSPSAVSHSITKLERQLGIRLLARSTRSVSPTVEGQQLLERVRPAFTLIDDAVAELDHAHGVPAGQI